MVNEITAPGFTALSRSAEELKAMLLEHGPISRQAMTIKAPRGGGLNFLVPSSAGDKEVKELDVVVLASRKTRRYFAEKYVPGEIKAPDCLSVDMVEGEGIPGGLCNGCPLADFTEDDDTGKSVPPPCTGRLEMMVLLDNSLIPMYLNIPVTSMGKVQNYFSTLLSEGRFPYAVKTRLTATKDRSKTGFECSRITAVFVGDLTPAEVAVVHAIKEVIATRRDETPVVPDEG